MYKTGFSIWAQAGAIMMGAPEVIGSRIDLFGPQKQFPLLEMQRMWLEKLQAGVQAAAAINLSMMGALPILMQPQTADSATHILNRQLKGLSAALKPYEKTVSSNQKRLRKKRR